MTKYNKEELTQKSNKELALVAGELGIEIGKKDSKNVIIDKIMKFQLENVGNDKKQDANDDSKKQADTANSNEKKDEAAKPKTKKEEEKEAKQKAKEAEAKAKEEAKLIKNTEDYIDLTNVPTQELKIEDLVPRQNGIFERITDAEYKELKASIVANGILVPIKVRPIAGGKFEILSGNNRVAIAKELGKTVIQGRVVDVDDRKAEEIEIDENLAGRKSHPALVLAKAYKKRIDLFGNRKGQRVDVTGDKKGSNLEWVADELGISHMKVARYLRLLNLLPQFQEAVGSGELVLGAGQTLGMVDQDIQDMVKEAVQNDYKKITTSVATAIKALHDKRKNEKYAVTNADIERIFEASKNGELNNKKEEKESGDAGEKQEENTGNRFTLVLPENLEEDVKEEIIAYLEDGNKALEILIASARERLENVKSASPKDEVATA